MYSESFYSYVGSHAERSAQVIVPLVQTIAKPTSVVDVGSARGHWLSVWRSLGVEDVLGVDGHEVDIASLVIPRSAFRVMDLAAPRTIGRRFDVAMCLEVAEHLPVSASEPLIDALCAAAPIVLFSAAFPGQGGNGHVNEQPLGNWIRRFAARDYHAIDIVRRAVIGDERVAPWYRANSMLYVARERLDSLPDVVRAFRVDETRVPDLAPLPLRVRALALRHLPVSAVTMLARAQNRLARGRAR